LGGGSGLGADALSAYCDYAAELLHPYANGGEEVQMFPGGKHDHCETHGKGSESGGDFRRPNGGRRVNRLGEFPGTGRKGSRARIRLGATVISARHDGPAEKSQVCNPHLFGGRKASFASERVLWLMAGGGLDIKSISCETLPAAQQEAYGNFFAHRA